MRSHTEEMSKLALTYANFALGSCLNLNEKNMLLVYKKLKSVLKSVGYHFRYRFRLVVKKKEKKLNA